MNCSFDKLWCETCMTYVVVTDSGARYNNGVSGTRNHSDKWIEGKLIFQNSIVPLARNEENSCPTFALTLHVSMAQCSIVKK